MIQITKGKVLKDDVVEISFLKVSKNRKPAKGSEEYKDPPHPDLVAAMKNFDVHAALLCYFIPASEIKDINQPDHPELINFHVTSFSTKGDDDDDKVTLSCQKTLPNGKTFGFNTPSIRLNAEGDDAYAFADDLKACIEAAKSEFRLYLDGKQAQDPQGKLDFDGPVTSMQVAQPVEEEFDPEKLEKPSVKKTKEKNKAAAKA